MFPKFFINIYKLLLINFIKIAIFSYMWKIFLFFIIFFPFLKPQSEVQKYLEKIESQMILFSQKLESDYLNRCNNNCELSYDACSTILPTLQCAAEFPSVDCDCYTPGRPLSLNKTTVKLADVSSIPTSVNNQDVREMICSTVNIEETLINIRQQIPSIKWNYVGTYNGVFRIFPGSDMCFQYDPRIRPWYASAASGYIINFISQAIFNFSHKKALKT